MSSANITEWLLRGQIKKEIKEHVNLKNIINQTIEGSAAFNTFEAKSRFQLLFVFVVAKLRVF